MKIFLDCDGVFAGFSEKVEELLGPDWKNYGDGIWSILEKITHFFDMLDLLENSVKIVDALRHHDLEFLTACPRPAGNFKTAPADKCKWIKRNVASDIPINTIVGGKRKVLWLKENPGAVLIDDYGRNIRLWEEHGGIGIKHECVETTLEKLHVMGLTK